MIANALFDRSMILKTISCLLDPYRAEVSLQHTQGNRQDRVIHIDTCVSS